MVAQNANQKKQIDDQLQQQEDSVYGDETASGTNPRPGNLTADTEDMMQQVTGNDPTSVSSTGKPVDDTLADEINKDEQALRGEPVQQDPNPNNDNRAVSNLDENIDSDAIGAQAGVSENLAESTGDPFDALTDADLGIKKNQ